MAELLVMTENRGAGIYAGDVVAVQRDGWSWGAAEAGIGAHSFWRVLRVPGAPEQAFADMLDPVTDANGAVVVYRRKLYAPEFIRACGDSVTAAELNAARKVKAIP